MDRRRFLASAAAAGAAGLTDPLDVLALPRVADATAAAGAGRSTADAAPPAAPPRNTAELTALLEELLAKYRLPGAVAGYFRDGETVIGAAGTANMNAGYAMTPDTGFITGSITKVWTATLVMTFVDEGRVDLATPLVEYLPALRFADPAVTRALTMRHMLNHSSGLDTGDFILETGELPEAVARFVAAMADRGQIHEPGRYASYNNGGWVVAGRVLEVISGRDYHTLLRERVIRPMGLKRTVLTAEEAILHRTAIGHVPDPAGSGAHIPTPVFLLPKSFAPAGSTLMPTVGDQLEFLRMHLAGGVAPNGTRIISEAAARAMATRTIGRPIGPVGFGLGWMHEERGGHTVLSHGGGSNGGRAQATLVPAAGAGYAAFINSSSSGGMHAELQQRLLGDVLGPEAGTPAPAAVAADVDPAPFLGVYRRAAVRVEVRRSAGGLELESRWIPAEATGTEAYSLGQPTVFAVEPLDASTLATAPDPVSGARTTWDFLEPRADGRFELLYASGRLARRVD